MRLSGEVLRIDWSDLKDRFIRSVEKGERWGQAFQANLKVLHDNPYAENAWAGGAGADTLRWLREGYHAPEFALAADMVPVALKRRVCWSEEDGDPDPGRLIGGFDDFYFATERSDRKPGLKVEVEGFFAALVKPQTVRQYGAWVAGALGALEAAGYDLEVTIGGPLDNVYVGQRGTADLQIVVKRANELSSFSEWSALFGPTGLRHLIFTGLGVASAAVGKKMTAFCGTSVEDTKWAVTYDRERNVLRFGCDQRSSGTFPLDTMNEGLTAAGLI